jgi:hypothetical protein
MKWLMFIVLFLPATSFGEDLTFNSFVSGKYGQIVGDEYFIYSDDWRIGRVHTFDQLEAKKPGLECARKGFKELKGWLEDEDSTISKYLKILKELGGSTSFYLWTNDYRANVAKKEFDEFSRDINGEKLSAEEFRKKQGKSISCGRMRF